MGLIIPELPAQKVGLVLSGGGAPGIAHIGIIKALEENNIPIDYIAATSIGAIVGGMYAMGLTPDQMISILKSDDFRCWTTGEIKSDNGYYSLNSDSKPGIIELQFQIDKHFSVNFNSYLLPTNLVSPHEMNYAFVPLCAQANALAAGDFDKLFVPFRCVASDIYKKEVVVFRQGDLGDAIRASSTFPFMFKPLEIDNRLLFDGGIFNNFPVNVMREDFKPDFTIGSVVAYNPQKPNKKDILMQLQNMIISPTDYSLPSADGLLLNFDLKAINTFDFSKVDELVKIGYDSVMKHLDEIKARTTRRVSAQELLERRLNFRGKFPELKFRNISTEGVDSIQKHYYERVFHQKNKVFDLEHFKKGYYNLISDDKISEVVPHVRFNPASGYFDLNLAIETQSQLKLLVGGNVSSSTSNQAYLGIKYQNLCDYAQSVIVDAQLGRIYNGLRLCSSIEIPSEKNLYLKLAFVLHKFDYFEGNRLFHFENGVANFTQTEAYSKLSIGVPLPTNGHVDFGVGYGKLSDNYSPDSIQAKVTSRNVNSTYLLGSVFGRIETNKLNNLMYPTKGYRYASSLQLIGGKETFVSANNRAQNSFGRINTLFQFKATANHYFPLSSRFTLGTYGELVYSSRELLQNYTATIIQTSSFHPTVYSCSVFNQAFCANQFAAIGIKPIYNFTDQLHIRSEAYWFIPYQTINRMADNSATYSLPFSSSQFMSETTLVFNFKVASAGLFVNYYSSAASQWNFGLNIGILLFNPKFAE